MAKNRFKNAVTALKYLTPIFLLGALVYFSIEIKPLDEVKKNREQKKFKPDEYARDFWDNRLMKHLDQAAAADKLLGLMENDMAAALRDHGRTVGISNVHYYFLAGQGKVLSVNDESAAISIRKPSDIAEIEIATDFIFGHAVRNGTGLIDVSDFSNSQDFNNISEEINTIITKDVLPDFREKIQPGMTVHFTGAAKVPDDETEIVPLRVIPVKLEVE